MERYVIALLIDKNEKADQFQDSLDTMTENIWDTLSKPQLKVNIYLNEQFAELNAPPPLTLDAESIRQRVKTRAKDILDDSDQIDQAQQLLSFSKTVPEQLVQAANDGAQFRGDKKYDKSVKAYEDAKRFARMLQEVDLAEEFDRQSKRSAEIPILERNRDKAVTDAREALRREEYVTASNKFREASGLSEKLGDVVGKEINGKKADILGQYAEIDASDSE
jgi:neutral trehalase